MILIGLKESSSSGSGVFGMGVIHSLTHCFGYSPEELIVLKISATGVANHGPSSSFTLGGKSSGAVLFILFSVDFVLILYYLDRL